MAVAPDWLRDHVAELAVDGFVPPRSRCWGPAAMATLVPDDEIRRRIEAELPWLPLDYFDEHVEVPPDWPAAVAAYLQLSEPLAAAATAAAAHGWTVVRLTAGHLHLVVDPGEVAHQIVQLAASASRASAP